MAATKKSSQLVIIGVSVFLIGAGLVFIGLRGGGDKKTDTSTAAKNAAAQQEAARNAVTQVRAAGDAATPVLVPIPKGMQAVAVQMSHVAGLAGYAKPGDLVNLYGTAKAAGKEKQTLEAPYSKLILSNVTVLDVSGATAGTAKGDPVFLLALSPADAEKVIFFAKFEGLWATLAQKGQTEVSTPGIDYASAVK